MKIFNFLLISVITFGYLQSQQPEGTWDDSQAPSTVDKEYLEKLEIGQIDPAVPINVNVKCMEFFERLADDKVDLAYKELLAESPINLNKDKLKLQIDKTNEAIKLYGKVLGYESAETVFQSNSYITVKFLSLHSFNPLLWTFTFFKSPTIGWIVLNLKLSDNVLQITR